MNRLNMMQMISQFRQNPMAMLNRRFNIPNGMHSPQDIVQYLLNSGQVTQEQVNQAMRMRNDPQFRNLFQ